MNADRSAFLASLLQLHEPLELTGTSLPVSVRKGAGIILEPKAGYERGRNFPRAVHVSVSGIRSIFP